MINKIPRKMAKKKKLIVLGKLALSTEKNKKLI